MVAFTKFRREVHEALRIARQGTPSSQDKAQEAAARVERAIAEGHAGYSTLGSGSYIRSAKYAVHLRDRYPNASDDAIRRAAHEIAWADSPLATRSRHREHQRDARDALIRVIDENKTIAQVGVNTAAILEKGGAAIKRLRRQRMQEDA